MVWNKSLLVVSVLLASISCKQKDQKAVPLDQEYESEYYTEAYRPQFHFTPEANWMNDPNGMVYHKGVYHLFYQYYPEDIIWGPMHWGHAISTDLVSWNHKPIALYPDDLGYIFSGSAVLDGDNTSGFGTMENPPLVAIYTYHDIEGEKAGQNDFQTQGIAYSLDNGDSWTKYDGNPVIGNDGVRDFRDPKVIWHRPSKSWILTLVAGDHAEFYRSTNLKNWAKVGSFGKEKGAHGGVWECPDLFPLNVNEDGEEKWVLLISINPGAPNGGSGTQYFVGDFDGNTFTTDQSDTKWIDWGTDNYAGVTFSNAPDDERIFIGWMSNWAYARDTPTERWRSAMTVPRKLTLRKMGADIELFNYPVDNLNAIVVEGDKSQIQIAAGTKENIDFEDLSQAEIKFVTTTKDFTLDIRNDLDEALTLTMNGSKQLFQLDRAGSGKTDFSATFANSVHQMPIPILPDGEYEVRILIDWSSIEIFINGGQYVMTDLVFPNADFNQLMIENTSNDPMELKDFRVARINGTWHK